jgi:hypothetical protein
MSSIRDVVQAIMVDLVAAALLGLGAAAWASKAMKDAPGPVIFCIALVVAAGVWVLLHYLRLRWVPRVRFFKDRSALNRLTGGIKEEIKRIDEGG